MSGLDTRALYAGSANEGSGLSVLDCSGAAYSWRVIDKEPRF